ncbi:hypothetical protein HK102_009465, partial [Quaeritorhiza haematococci]
MASTLKAGVVISSPHTPTTPALTSTTNAMHAGTSSLDTFMDEYVTSLRTLLSPVEELEELRVETEAVKEEVRKGLKRLEDDGDWVVVDEDEVVGDETTEGGGDGSSEGGFGRGVRTTILTDEEYTMLLDQFDVVRVYTEFVKGCIARANAAAFSVSSVAESTPPSSSSAAGTLNPRHACILRIFHTSHVLLDILTAPLLHNPAKPKSDKSGAGNVLFPAKLFPKTTARIGAIVVGIARVLGEAIRPSEGDEIEGDGLDGVHGGGYASATGRTSSLGVNGGGETNSITGSIRPEEILVINSPATPGVPLNTSPTPQTVLTTPQSELDAFYLRIITRFHSASSPGTHKGAGKGVVAGLTRAVAWALLRCLPMRVVSGEMRRRVVGVVLSGGVESRSDGADPKPKRSGSAGGGGMLQSEDLLMSVLGGRNTGALTHTKSGVMGANESDATVRHGAAPGIGMGMGLDIDVRGLCELVKGAKPGEVYHLLRLLVDLVGVRGDINGNGVYHDGNGGIAGAGGLVGIVAEAIFRVCYLDVGVHSPIKGSQTTKKVLPNANKLKPGAVAEEEEQKDLTTIATTLLSHLCTLHPLLISTLLQWTRHTLLTTSTQTPMNNQEIAM